MLVTGPTGCTSGRAIGAEPSEQRAKLPFADEIGIVEKTAREPFISSRSGEQHAAPLPLCQGSKRDAHDAIGMVGKVLIEMNVFNEAVQTWCLWTDAV